jgi:hypothetical protein
MAAKIKAFIQGIKLRGDHPIKALGEGYFIYKGKTFNINQFGEDKELLLSSINLNDGTDIEMRAVVKHVSKRKKGVVARGKNAFLVTDRILFDKLVEVQK